MTDEGLPKAAIAMPVYLLFYSLARIPSSVKRVAFASFPSEGEALPGLASLSYTTQRSVEIGRRCGSLQQWGI